MNWAIDPNSTQRIDLNSPLVYEEIPHRVKTILHENVEDFSYILTGLQYFKYILGVH